MKNFNDYFEYAEDYPSGKVFDILPWNVEWCYCSTTFLNGFINYVKIKKAYVISRYTKWDEEADNSIKIKELTGWKDFKGTKKEHYDILTRYDTGSNCFNFQGLDNAFSDDVLILARVDHDVEKKEQKNCPIYADSCQADVGPEENCFIFFWYDRDCSDSCIGRFKTKDSEEDVITSFSAYCTSETLNNEGGEEAKEIPLPYFAHAWIHD